MKKVITTLIVFLAMCQLSAQNLFGIVTDDFP